MPTIPPALDLGLQTLGEAIQLTPASPALAILSTSRNILQMIIADKGRSQDEQRLAQMVLDTAVAYSDGVKQLDETACKDAEIKHISDNLYRCLESISKALLNKPKARFFARLLTQSSRRRRMKGWEADLEQISLQLMAQIQLRSVKLSRAISLEFDKDVKQGSPTMEERIQQANQEALELIKSQVLKQTGKKLDKSSFGHFPPVPSPIFYGRSDQVDCLVESLVKVPSYHAILGPGGIGKTSVALNMLHDPRIIEVYGKHRYFLACEATLDVGGIIAGLADIFSLNEGDFVKQFTGLCQVINSNILFLLDNFETPWERTQSRQKVEDLLTNLSSIPNLSIVITLRGAERPCGIRWSHPFLPILGPLDISAASQTFVAIADIGQDDPDMKTLLEAVEFIPLAITLLAAQATYTSCAFLLEQWQTRKTSMITRGWESRLSSLDLSISISLSSSRFVSNPQALSLLQSLSLLPDGATLEDLRQMMTDDVDIHTSLSTLLQVALATTARHGRVQVLAPIREYVQSKHPMSPALLQRVLSYYAELSRYASLSQWTAEAKNVDDKLTPCIGNIHHVIMMCLTVETLTEEALSAGINVASFRRDSRSGSIGHLLEECVKVARGGKKPALLAACLEKIGIRMCYSSSDRPLALECLEESVNISRSLSNNERSDILVSALTSLSWYLTVIWRIKEAIQFAKEAVNSISPSTSPHLSALAHMYLGSALIRTRNFSESRNLLERAGSYFNSRSSPILSFMMSECYEIMYFERAMYKQSLQAANEGLSLPAVVDSDTQRGRRLGNRGLTFGFLSRFEDARRDFREAIQCFASSGSATDLSRTYCWLGMSYIACGDYEEAELSIQAANQFQQTGLTDAKLTLAILELYRNHPDQSIHYLDLSSKELATSGYSLSSPTHYYRFAIRSQIQIKQRAEEALSTCILATIAAHKLQNTGAIAGCILCLGDVYLFIQKDVSASTACYQACLGLVRYLGCWRWIANALMRLGVADYFRGDTRLAVRRLNQAIRFYEETDGKPYLESCKETLKAFEAGAALENIPIFQPISMCGFVAKTGFIL